MARSPKTVVAAALLTVTFLVTGTTHAHGELCQSPAHETALQKQGALYSVTALINGKKVELIVDSGAETIILTPQAAKRVGLSPSGPSLPMAVTGGSATLNLVALETVSVAYINAQKLVGGVMDHNFGGGVDGVLGRSFLNDFIYNINPGTQRLTLYALGCNEERIGSETKKWWQHRYVSLRDPLRRYKGLLALKLNNNSVGYQKIDSLVASLSAAQLQKLVDFYELQLWRLNERANAQEVPLAWRNKEG